MDAAELFEEHLDLYLVGLRSTVDLHLYNSMVYSLRSGGKRFRPLLAMQFAETFGVHPKRVLPWALAVELIHTYSLIHDDLPCMDDDQLRRGQATNHIKFGESTALLAGDAMISEAFGWIANQYSDTPEVVPNLVRLLARAIGPAGMVGGQVRDMQLGASADFATLMQVHALKTAALIEVAVAGAASIIGLSEEKQKSASQFGHFLGLAFQLKDDLLDAETPHLAEKISKELSMSTDRAMEELKKLAVPVASPLHEMLEFNRTRSH